LIKKIKLRLAYSTTHRLFHHTHLLVLSASLASHDVRTPTPLPEIFHQPFVRSCHTHKYGNNFPGSSMFIAFTFRTIQLLAYVSFMHATSCLPYTKNSVKRE